MKYKICINAGHAPNGVPDAGACYHGLRESDINCLVSHRLTEELVSRGFEVTFVQDDDLKKVCNIANGVQANLFVSIHCNAFGNEMVGGSEVCIYNKSSRAYECALKTCDNICYALGTANRGVKNRSDLYVLKHTAMPAMLIEMFFISNPNDIAKYEGNTDGLVSAIADGIEFYFK